VSITTQFISRHDLALQKLAFLFTMPCANRILSIFEPRAQHRTLHQNPGI
jgi:hypothetical protein